ncbi:MAG: hypothetical protein NTW05_24080, partial [Pseudonocardiales bacterium]|nr:hypothetical protein [Pseudonocardiales bacterium]
MKIPAVARRAGWNLADQMVSSLTNAVLSFMVANAVDAESFGGFSVAFTVFALIIGAARALATSPLNIRFSDVDEAEQKRAASFATGTSLLLGFVVGIGCVVAGLFLSGPTSQALIVMGIVLPAVVVQDSYRFVFFSRQTPAKAALNDSFWALLQLGAVGVMLFTGVSAVGPLVLAWGLSGAAAVLLAVRQSASVPSPRSTLAWLKEQSNLTRYLFASWATQQGSSQGAYLVIAAVGSVVANGALRGAQILLGPTSIISSAAMTFSIPEFSRRRTQFTTSRQWLLSAVAVSGVVSFLGLCWGSIFLLMPDSVGAFLLNETWPATRELLFAAVVAQVLACATIGPVVMLYAIDRASATLRIQLVLGAATFLGGVGGVIVGGGPGAQWGFAIANGVVLPFWFIRLIIELRRKHAVVEEPDEADEGVKELDPERTMQVAAHRATATHFLDDLNTAQMATMVMPRVTPAPSPRPRPRPQPMPQPVPQPVEAPDPGSSDAADAVDGPTRVVDLTAPEAPPTAAVAAMPAVVPAPVPSPAPEGDGPGPEPAGEEPATDGAERTVAAPQGGGPADEAGPSGDGPTERDRPEEATGTDTAADPGPEERRAAPPAPEPPRPGSLFEPAPRRPEPARAEPQGRSAGDRALDRPVQDPSAPAAPLQPSGAQAGFVEPAGSQAGLREPADAQAGPLEPAGAQAGPADPARDRTEPSDPAGARAGTARPTDAQAGPSAPDGTPAAPAPAGSGAPPTNGAGRPHLPAESGHPRPGEPGTGRPPTGPRVPQPGRP